MTTIGPPSRRREASIARRPHSPGAAGPARAAARDHCRRRARWSRPPPPRWSRTSAISRASERLLRDRIFFDRGQREAGDHTRAAEAQLDAKPGAGQRGRAPARRARRRSCSRASGRLPRRAPRSMAAKLNLGYTAITATQDGVIGQRQVKPGQLVGVGHPDHDAHALAECLGHRQLQGDSAHSHGGRAKGRNHRRHLSGTYAARTFAGIRAGIGRRVRAAAARQCHRQFHQGRAAHRGENR